MPGFGQGIQNPNIKTHLIYFQIVHGQGQLLNDKQVKWNLKGAVVNPLMK